MAASVASETRSYKFDDRNIRWQKLATFEHFVFAMLDVNEKKGLVDFILKFDPNQQIFLHRHTAHTNTLVVQGEHRLYEPNGKLKEIRPVGSYTSSPPGEPHREGAGSETCVVYYSIRAEGDTMFEVLDDDLKIVGTLGMKDFINLFAERTKA
jgi:quercetin dioxygenase-like cupin family protein